MPCTTQVYFLLGGGTSWDLVLFELLRLLFPILDEIWESFGLCLCLARHGFVVCLSKTWSFFFCSSLGLVFLLCFVYKGLDFTFSWCTLCLMAKPSGLFFEMLVEFFIALDLILGESSRFCPFFICESWCLLSFSHRKVEASMSPSLLGKTCHIFCSDFILPSLDEAYLISTFKTSYNVSLNF